MKTSNFRREAGVSLMELLIVLGIIAILAALAITSYRQYILRGNRTAATGTLHDLASREESYFFSNNAYTNNLTILGEPANAPASGTALYSITVAAASSTDYTVQATAVGTQLQDTQCTSFTLTREGQKASVGTGSSTTCWGSQ
jgi:type IV pilus assembly protein PilE